MRDVEPVAYGTLGLELRIRTAQLILIPISITKSSQPCFLKDVYFGLPLHFDVSCWASQLRGSAAHASVSLGLKKVAEGVNRIEHRLLLHSRRGLDSLEQPGDRWSCPVRLAYWQALGCDEDV